MSIKQKAFCLIMISIFMLGACNFKTTLQASSYVAKSQVGDASYYADKFIGRPTASGELYDASKFTAAHRSLPFGTKVLVTNISNGKSVLVRINDRGPFVKNRLIDLSKAAAKQIGMVGKGVVKVRMSVQ